ncbi:hypothetical protein C461_10703 [Halorubrum aidingense JCM 13560]|uniref:Uncharacterized protein n=1 Tax=Halorubrum aidingense JCM 13560 TaxID=1230454 RepID=M0PAE2_9EURY|nr:hypothetical protein [Halorubrum aidingense]EMA66504.1 hypothetical protein C461_10703 [Halorubrum aidingense JCM 13560]
MSEPEPTRRRLLWGIGAGGSVALAGCTSGSGSDGGPGSDDGSGSDDPDASVHQVGRALTGPAWDSNVRRGFCALLTDEDGDPWLLREADAETRAFVEETDFDASVLAYAESVGPTTCHSEISFADVAVEDGTLVGAATVEDTAEANEACGEAITYSGALLRVTTDPLPDAIRLSITDGWGETAEVSGEDGVLDAEALPGGVRPDRDPASIPAAFECETEGFERHPQAYEGEVNWGDDGGVSGGDDGGVSGGDDSDGEGSGGDGPLALRAVIPGDDDPASEPLTIARGTRFRIELTNVSARAVHVGNQGKYNLELRTESGWTEIRGGDRDDTFEYTDEAIGVRPGETLHWEFEMTEAGLVEGGPHADTLRVCPDLLPGRYRFVFWGADDLAVAFDYVGERD